MSGLRRIQATAECIGDVRGKGLMVAVELVKDRENKAPARTWRAEVIAEAFRRGLLLLGCGENSVRFCPALTVSAEEIDTCLTIFEEALRAVAG
jgi:4-aminobutyrate aminotransferase